MVDTDLAVLVAIVSVLLWSTKRLMMILLWLAKRYRRDFVAWKYSKKRQRSDGLKQIDGKKKKVKKYGDVFIIGVDLASGKDFTCGRKLVEQ